MYLPIRQYMGICLYTYIALTISDTIRIWDFMNYHFPTRHETQTMHEISYGFETTDCFSEVSWFVSWIEVNSNRDDFVWIPEANRPETRYDTYEWEIIWIWDLRIADTKEAWIIHQITVNSSRDYSKLIPEANRPGDVSVNKSVEVNWNKFIIRELDGYQSRHQWDSISYNLIEPIDDYRDDARAHTSTTVASPAMRKLAILQRRFTNYARFTSIHIADGSSNRNYLWQYSTE